MIGGEALEMLVLEDPARSLNHPLSRLSGYKGNMLPVFAHTGLTIQVPYWYSAKDVYERY